MAVKMHSFFWVMIPFIAVDVYQGHPPPTIPADVAFVDLL
jgi:hypothetical protein